MNLPKIPCAIILAASAAAILSGCGTSRYAATGYRDVAPDRVRIELSVAGKDMRPAARVGHYFVGQYQEYAMFRGADARAEAILVVIPTEPPDGVLDFEETVASSTAGWNAFRGHDLIWGEAEPLGNGLGVNWIRRFRDTSAQRDCAGFTATWDRPPLDELNRPTKVFFGYYCAAPGDPMSPDAARQALLGFKVRGVNAPYRPESPAAGPADGARRDILAATAKQGLPGRPTGRADFPLALARQIRLSHDNPWWVND